MHLHEDEDEDEDEDGYPNPPNADENEDKWLEYSDRSLRIITKYYIV